MNRNKILSALNHNYELLTFVTCEIK